MNDYDDAPEMPAHPENDDQGEQLRREVERGQQAAQVLEHPLFVEAFDQYRARLVAEWESSPVRDAEGREKLWLMVKTVDAVRGHLEGVMQTGKMATLQRQERASRWQEMAQAAREWIGRL